MSLLKPLIPALSLSLKAPRLRLAGLREVSRASPELVCICAASVCIWNLVRSTRLNRQALQPPRLYLRSAGTFPIHTIRLWQRIPGNQKLKEWCDVSWCTAHSQVFHLLISSYIYYLYYTSPFIMMLNIVEYLWSPLVPFNTYVIAAINGQFTNQSIFLSFPF